MDLTLKQQMPVEGDLDVVNEVKKDLVAIRAGYDVTPVQYKTLLTMAAEIRIALDGTDEQTIDQVFSNIEQDFEARAEVGENQYGHRLQTNNGRDPLRDLYEEILDSVNYLKQCLLEKRF